MTDYFEAETAIVARLKEQVTDVPDNHVFTPFGLDGMMENTQPSPALHVIYAGDVVSNDSAGQRSRLMIGQRWLVVLAVRNPKAQLKDTTEIRTAAGLIVPKLLNALQGWAPVEWMRPLGRVGGPAAGYSSAFAYFPFMFEGRIST